MKAQSAATLGSRAKIDGLLGLVAADGAEADVAPPEDCQSK